ncbi:MAG: glycoside hydrolase family 2 protein [Nocardioides sp.]|nr:glycoside hydrolase family 2 protein [Nocardioides sp.]
MHATNLGAGWHVVATGGADVPDHLVGVAVDAVVPGTVHTDLLRAGLVPDPYLGVNETALAWMHRARWRYDRVLEAAPAEPGERVDLVFDGLDTVAPVRLAGQVVGRAANQHRTHRFDVREVLAGAEGGPMPLTVEFDSALEHAEAEAGRIGARPLEYPHPLNMVRKMACSFGWDWGPDLQTAGIWRPVRLERWRVARLASVRPIVTVAQDHRRATVRVEVDVERAGPGDGDSPILVTARLTPPGAGSDDAAVADVSAVDVRATIEPTATIEATATVEPGATSAVVVLVVDEPALWWPVGHGGHPLHDLDVRLDSTDCAPEHYASEPLDRWQRCIGLRSVRLDTSEDEHGTAFVIEVNGEPIFVKGANWIPDDHLLTRITRERLARRLDQALGANLNLLRVWGGGIYESEDFYELCDEAGLMVWQDFLLACAAYPEEEPHRSEFEAEAREHVARLTAHPSLVLWNGGNENLWGHLDWGWREKLGGRTWGHYYYTELFPSIVAELAPTTPYADGSPYSPRADPDVIHPNHPDHGTHHEWEVWNRTDYTAYRENVPRFCSEFGFQGPPAWSTSARAVSNADGSVAGKEDPVFLLHQKAEDGNGKLDRGLAPHLGVPEDFADWHWATQLNQARAITHALTHYRSWWPRTAGAIVWQLNDCWPVTSWAAVDGDEVVKPLWWALRASFTDRLLTVQDRADEGSGEPHLVVAAVNDTGIQWAGQVRARRERLDGRVLAEASLPLAVAPRSVALLEVPEQVRSPGDPREEVLVVEGPGPDGSTPGQRTVHSWCEDVDLRLVPHPLDASAEAIEGGYLVTVTATRSLVKDLALLVDRLDPAATVDSALITLPAGQQATIRVDSEVTGLETALTRAPVLRTANDLATTRSRPHTPEPEGRATDGEDHAAARMDAQARSRATASRPPG